MSRRTATALQSKELLETLAVLPIAYRARRAWSDRSKESDLPLFAGYVFCRFGHTEKSGLLNTPGGAADCRIRETDRRRFRTPASAIQVPVLRSANCRCGRGTFSRLWARIASGSNADAAGARGNAAQGERQPAPGGGNRTVTACSLAASRTRAGDGGSRAGLPGRRLTLVKRRARRSPSRPDCGVFPKPWKAARALCAPRPRLPPRLIFPGSNPPDPIPRNQFPGSRLFE